MANGRSGSKGARKGVSGRDGGGFVALPWSVLDSHAYRNLSANARALLLEVARQFHSDDNGRMLLSRAYLNARGWTSSDMIMKAKRELLANALIHETVQGQRPHKASWYAMTWQALDKIPGIDPDAALTFRRGAYRDVPPKFAVPPHGTEDPRIVPPHGTERASPVPLCGPISALSDPRSVPLCGHPLEMPSAGAAPVPTSAPSTKAKRAGGPRTATAATR